MPSPISNVPQGNLIGNEKEPTLAWLKTFSDHAQVLQDLTRSGTTSNRPTTQLYKGKAYFDETLDFEIHYNGTQWVKYDGTPA